MSGRKSGDKIFIKVATNIPSNSSHQHNVASSNTSLDSESPDFPTRIASVNFRAALRPLINHQLDFYESFATLRPSERKLGYFKKQREDYQKGIAPLLQTCIAAAKKLETLDRMMLLDDVAAITGMKAEMIKDMIMGEREGEGGFERFWRTLGGMEGTLVSLKEAVERHEA